MARIGTDLAIFEALDKAQEPVTVAEMANNFDTIGPVLQQLPKFLMETNYQDITDGSKTAFQLAFHTELPVFTWLANQPELFAHAQEYMKFQRAGTANWMSVFPFEQELGDWRDKPVFVDIGGGLGQQCMALKSKFPNLTGKIVLQDLPQTVKHVASIEGVEIQAQDFFEPQVVKGEPRAKFYYLRNIIHDWPDDKALIILKNIVSAMSSSSRILVDEMVLPDTGVHWQAAQADLTMMAALGSRERTRGQWHTLLVAADLEILQILQYGPASQESIIVAASH
ncbi:MAG: hypothetical protein Q9165_006952 [Trypethelium subeluteriae]